MSLTALAFLGIYGGGLILALTYHPLFGLVAYMWSFYQNPATAWWGPEVPDLRWSLIAAVVTLIATLMGQARAHVAGTPEARRALTNDEPAPWHANGAARLLIVYVAWMWLQTLWALRGDYHLEGCILYTKYLVLFYILYRLIADRQSLELFSWAHVAGCFIWGWIAFGTEIHGRMELVLGPGVDDSNAVGAHLTTGLAFAGLLFLGLRDKRRWLAFAAIPFILNGVILTASRSALVAMLAGGAAAAVLAPRAHRRQLSVYAGLGVVLLLLLAQNEIFWERAGTIGETDEEQMDKSAASRVEMVKSQWRMALDYPLGTGHRGNEVLSPRYIPEEFLTAGGSRSAHNTLMAVLVDQGFPGALMFVALHLWVAVRLYRMKGLDRMGLPPSLGIYRAAAGAALAACFASGLFVNLIKLEVALWMLALLAIVDNLGRVAVAASGTNEVLGGQRRAAALAVGRAAALPERIKA